MLPRQTPRDGGRGGDVQTVKRLPILRWAITAAVLLAAAGTSLWGADPPPVTDAAAKNAGPPDSAERISFEQQRIAERFRHLEQVLARMKELAAATDPRRAALLEKAYKQSKDDLIDVQFESLVVLLEKDRLAKAMKNQSDLERDLKALLQLLLSENRAKRIRSEKARLREYLRRLNTLIKQEKDVQARTAGGDNAKKLAGEQDHIAKKTGTLAKDIQDREEEEVKKEGETSKPGGAEARPAGEKKGGDAGDQGSPSGGQGQGGDPSSSPSPSHPARGHLEAARQRMKQAEQKLQEAKREGAVEKQEEALRELQEAKAVLEEILRQLREEEIARMLAMLQARFQKMLKMQQAVYEGTVRLDRVPPAQRTHNHEIEGSRLSNKELQIVVEADKALALLKEDGTAVAFPEAVEQMRDDMQQVVHRLAQTRVGAITQAIEQDILAALEEMIEALKKAQKELAGGKPPPPPPGGMPSEPALIDLLAEVKMIRALQMRVNRRTQRYAKLVEGEQAENAELVEALRRLAEREQRIHRVTRDLYSEKNQ